MPKFNVASLLEEDEATKGLNLPFRFGKGFDVDYTLKDGTWDKTDNPEFVTALIDETIKYLK